MGSAVLIIDPDQAFGRTLSTALEARGYAPHWSSEASLEGVRSRAPEAVILSAELQETSGFAFCGRLRRDRELGAVSILVLSSAPKEVIDAHSQRPERANLYARKPASAQAVVELVQQMLHEAPPPLHPSTAESAPLEPSKAEAELPVKPRGKSKLYEFKSELESALRSEPTDATTKRLAAEDRTEKLRSTVKREQKRGQELERIARDLMTYVEALSKKQENSEVEKARLEKALASEQTVSSELQARLSDTEQSFRTFHEEVTRIFTEKDQEEQALLTQLEEAEKRASELTFAKEQQKDDAERVRILRQELETVNEELELAKSRVSKAEAEANEALTENEALSKQRVELSIELDEAKRQVASVGAAFEASNETTLDLEDQVKALKADTQAWSQRFTTEQHEKAEIARRLEATEQALEEVQEEADTHGESVLELRIRLDAQESALAQAKHREGEAAQLRDRMKRLFSTLERERQIRSQLERSLSQARTELSKRRLGPSSSSQGSVERLDPRGRPGSVTTPQGSPLTEPSALPRSMEEAGSDRTEVFRREDLESS